LEVTYYGHAAVKVKSDVKMLFDPWIEENPKFRGELKDVEDVDLVLVTHDHADHGFSDAVRICKRTGATLVGIFELASQAEARGVKTAVGGNIGGPIKVKGVEVILTPAVHSCSAGSPVGFVVLTSEGAVYHAGDTGLFYAMKLIGELYRPKVAFLPVGGFYTMGPREAAKAVELISPEKVVPIHWGTFPVLEETPDRFVEEVKKLGVDTEVIVLKPGEKAEV